MDKLTLGEAKEVLWDRVANSSTDSRVVTAINECSQAFFRNQNFSNRIYRMNVAVYDDMITLPREVATVVACSDGCRDYPVKSQWYEFSPSGFAVNTEDNSSNSVNLIDYGSEWPTFRDVPSSGVPLRIYSSGWYTEPFEVRVQGLDLNGEEVYNNWQDLSLDPGDRDDPIRIRGESFYFGVPGSEPTDDYERYSTFVNGLVSFSRIDNIIKPVTDEPIKITYNAGADTIGIYGPSETNPGYRRYRLPTGFDDGDTVMCLVRRGFTKAVKDNDVIYPNDITSLRTMMDAWNKQEAGMFQEASQLRAIAYGQLDKAFALERGPVTGQVPFVDLGGGINTVM